VQCGIKYNSNLIVVCRTSSFEAGFPIEYNPDYQVRTEDHGVVRPGSDVSHLGSVSFDIYEAQDGENIASFEVSVRISGVIVKDRKGMGYSNVNLARAQASIRKARKKGLTNILGRLRNQFEIGSQ